MSPGQEWAFIHKGHFMVLFQRDEKFTAISIPTFCQPPLANRHVPLPKVRKYQQYALSRHEMGCVVMDPNIILIGISVVSVLVGGLIGFVIADRRMKRLYTEVRSEVSRLRSVAVDKLSHEPVDLESLLRNLNSAVQDTFKAAEALESHETVVARQHEGGKEVIASSRYIIRMIDELGGKTPEPSEPVISNLPPQPLKKQQQSALTAKKSDDKKPMRRRK